MTDTTVLDTIRRRRVTRHFTDEAVTETEVWQILRAARQASSAGNRRIHRFLVIGKPETIDRVRPFAPGILGQPPLLILMSTDHKLAQEANVQLDRDRNTWIDVGTALMNMMLAAEALGLGSCPATSFSQFAIARVLQFPDSLVPELILQVGHPERRQPGARTGTTRPTISELTEWEELGCWRRP